MSLPLRVSQLNCEDLSRKVVRMRYGETEVEDA